MIDIVNQKAVKMISKIRILFVENKIMVKKKTAPYLRAKKIRNKMAFFK